MNAAPNIYLRDITFSYAQQKIFENFNLTLSGGKTTCLLGPSGCGKTTLLRLIAQLIPHDQIIQTDNEIPIHWQIAYIAQSDLLLPWLNVLDNILIGLKLRNCKRTEIKIKKNLAKQLLNQVGLHKAEKLFPHQLSGGMKQRVSLVRAILEDKPVILMDEPFSSLDMVTRIQLQHLMVDLLKNKTILLVTHDPLEALQLADDVHILSGAPSQVYFSMTINAEKPRNLDNPDLKHCHTQLLKHLMLSATT